MGNLNYKNKIVERKYLTLARLGFLKVVFPGGEGVGDQFDPPPPLSYIKKKLSNLI